MIYDLGIDVGTSYTAGAICRKDGNVEVLGLGPIVDSIPSVIFLASDQALLVGDSANRRAVIEQEVPAREFKRRLGDTEPEVLSGVPFSTESLMARMLGHVRDRATQHEGLPPRHIAVTHPANWSPYKLELFQQALWAAGISDATTLSEPTAAALAYASEARIPVGATLAVYDLGGGTFDAAVLRKEDEGFVLLGESVGIERLGGADFDDLVLEYVQEMTEGTWPGDDPAAAIPLLHLRRACTEAKELLSSEERVNISVLLPGIDTSVEITRDSFEAMIEPLVTLTVDSLGVAMKNAKVTADDLDTILLVGGTSRIPMIGRMLAERYGPIIGSDVDPLFAVVRGAAIAASLGAADQVDTRADPAPTEVPAPAPTEAPAPLAAPGHANPAPAPIPTLPKLAEVQAGAPLVIPGPSPAAPRPPVSANGASQANGGPPVGLPRNPPRVGSNGLSSGPRPIQTEQRVRSGMSPPPPAAVGQAIPAPDPLAVAEVPTQRPGSRNAMIAIIVFAVLLAAALIGLFVYRQSRSGEVEAVRDGVTTTDSQPSAAGGTGGDSSKQVASGAGMVVVPQAVYSIGVPSPGPNAVETLELEIEVEEYSIDVTEVTNEHYKFFVDRQQGLEPLSWPAGRYPSDLASHPVEGISFGWAEAFCSSLGKRLPTEVEWEVAARGVDGRPYPWGSDVAAVVLPDSGTYAAGSIPANVSPFGAQDMVGNVWEWVADSYDPRITEDQRVLRGGQNGFLSKGSARLPVEPTASNALKDAGFRCAADETDPDRPPLEFGSYSRPGDADQVVASELPTGVLIQDEFNDPRTDWLEAQTESYRYGYHPNGYFHLEAKGANVEVIALAPAVPTPGARTRAATQAFIEPDNTKPGGTFSYGLIIQSDQDLGTGLVFTVDPRSSGWMVAARNSAGTYDVLERASRQIPQTANLEIEIGADDLYEFRIDGNVVHRRVEAGLTGSGAGLVLLADQDVEKVHIHFENYALVEVQ